MLRFGLVKILGLDIGIVMDGVHLIPLLKFHKKILKDKLMQKWCVCLSSATVITRSNEIDVAAEDIRIVILIHFKDGKRFYWPVLRQRPSADDIEGILGG